MRGLMLCSWVRYAFIRIHTRMTFRTLYFISRVTHRHWWQRTNFFFLNWMDVSQQQHYIVKRLLIDWKRFPSVNRETGLSSTLNCVSFRSFCKGLAFRWNRWKELFFHRILSTHRPVIEMNTLDVVEANAGSFLTAASSRELWSNFSFDAPLLLGYYCPAYPSLIFT